MSKIQFEKEQLDAINARKGHFLVSASAGSGKTSVLGQRATNIILEGTPIKRLLILTFAKKAAGEMAERIKKNLIENDRMDLANEIDLANIQTFDAFSLAIVKKYHNYLGIDRDVNVLDTTVAEVLRKRYLDEIFTRLYNEQNGDFIKLISHFVLKQDANLKSNILSIYKKIELIVDEKDYLEHFENNFFSKQYIEKIIQDNFDDAKRLLKEAICILEDEHDELLIDVTSYIQSFYNAKNHDELRLLFLNKANFPAKGKKWSIELKNAHSIAKAKFSEAESYFIDVDNYNNTVSAFLKNQDEAKIIIEIVKELFAKFLSFKKLHNIYEFVDISKMLIRLLEIEEVRKEIKNKFDYIMIDEYQDTSDIQERAMNLLDDNNVFQVGDVKQSIYGFRNANPNIFLNKFNDYQKQIGGKLISLNKNFRSSAEVIEMNNFIFSKIMKPPLSNFDYRPLHIMKIGSDKNRSNDDGLKILIYKKSDNNKEKEAHIIAQDILSKMKQNHSLSFNDFSILTQTKSNFTLLKKILTSYGIPLRAEYDPKVDDEDTFVIIKNLFELINIYSDDTKKATYYHRFVSVLRSFLYQVSDENLSSFAKLRNYSSFELEHIVHELNSKKDALSLKDLTLLMYDKFNLYEKVRTVPNITRSFTIMDKMYHFAVSFDDLMMNLDDLVLFFNDLTKFDISLQIDDNSTNENVVKLMTIHASKGLEFPIVYFPYLNLRGKNDTDTILFDAEYGLFLPNYDYYYLRSPLKIAIDKKLKSELAREKLRLFYVGLTRAKKNNILILPKNAVKNPKLLDSSTSIFSRYVNAFIFDKDGSFESCLDISSLDDISSENFSFASDKSMTIVPQKFILKDILVPTVKRQKPLRASKELDAADSNILSLGEELHSYMEYVDFKNVNLDFILDEKKKDIIRQFLKCDFFKNANKAVAKHEFRFFDEENDVHGIIDLLLIYEDHIDIIDYKVANIDDESYDEQLKIYQNYIKKLTNLPVKMYLASIIKGRVREVKG